MKKRILSFFTVFAMLIGISAYFPTNVTHAVSQIDALIATALAEEGYTEGANNYSKYGEWYYNNVSKSADYAHAAWCAMFISWCARQAGIPTSVIKNNAWAGSMGSSKGTGNFGGTYYPKGSITPQKGDIVYYGWGSSSSEHVEIVISTTSNTINSIGGNTGGGTKVYIHKNYSFTSSDIVGYERPNYNGSANPPSNDDELGIGYPRPSGNPNMSSGSTGSGVYWLQSALNKANNAGLTVDGQFGSGTKQAVINFQKANGLDADGIAGPATVNKLVEVIKEQMKPAKAPSWAWISATDDRTTFNVGEQIHFWFSADETNGAISHYLIGINKDGNRIITEECGKDYYVSFDEPGDYSVYVSAYNTSGLWADSNIINFQVVNPVDIGTDFYAIIANVSTKYLLSNINSNATMSLPTDETNQLWYFSRNSNGSYTIESYDRTQALDVAGGATTDGTNIGLYEKNGTLAQQWYIYYAPNAGICFKSALGNSCLDVYDGVSNAYLWQSNETTAQIFDFYRIDLNGTMPKDMGDDFNAKIINTATGKALTNIDNANLAGSDSQYKEEQTWYFTRMNNGSYKILSYCDLDQSLDIVNYGTGNATNVAVCVDSNNMAQRFFLYEIDGDIYIKAMCSDKVFNMDLNTMNVSTWNYVKGVDPEKFSIKKLDADKAVKLEITSKPNKLTYNAGEKLSTQGLTIKNIYETGNSLTTSSGFTVDKNILKYGDIQVTVKYGNLTTSFNINVNPLKGDLNLDNSLNISDIILLKKHMCKLIKANKTQLSAADINSDGVINVFDLILIKRMLINNK